MAGNRRPLTAFAMQRDSAVGCSGRCVAFVTRPSAPISINISIRFELVRQRSAWAWSNTEIIGSGAGCAAAPTQFVRSNWMW